MPTSGSRSTASDGTTVGKATVEGTVTVGAAIDLHPLAAVSAVVTRAAAPLRTQAAAVLREAILSLKLREGERLVERQLIGRLGVSRTTVREALRELESEGLVEVIPQRGAVVRTVDPAEAADLYGARVAIETLVVSRFIERAADSTVRDLVDAIESYTLRAGPAYDVIDMLAAKDDFYRVLREGAASPALGDLLDGLRARIRMLQARSLSQPGRRAESAAELRQLGQAVAARDSRLAAQLYTDHVHAAERTGLGQDIA
jgi:DNA-binding GntR family transcriptional regulator